MCDRCGFSLSSRPATTPLTSSPARSAICASSVAHMAERAGELVKGVVAGLEERLKPQRSHIADYVGLLDESEKRLVKAFQQVRKTHPDEPDIGTICKLFAQWCG